MDRRLLPIIQCPVCCGDLVSDGQATDTRLICGTLQCIGCKQEYPLQAETPELVAPHTNRGGACWCGQEEALNTWIPANFTAWQHDDLPPPAYSFVQAIRAVRGPVIDIASGPGGSYCIPVMQDGRTDRLLIMSDLSAEVMAAWRQCLREAGWAERCSTMTVDARRLPFHDASLAAVTSVNGFANIYDNGRAYAEAARVLQAGGHLFDLVRFYEEGGPTYRLQRQLHQIAVSWGDYKDILTSLNLVIERKETLNRGRGKTDPSDGLPLGDDAWEHMIIFARRV